MKLSIRSKSAPIFGMANIPPKRSGIPVNVWSDHGGSGRQVSHRGTPRAKIGYQGNEISISIEEKPRILASKYKKIPSDVMKKLETGMDYVGRDYDLFLKHYLDSDDSFDDQDLFNALHERGDFN